MTLISKSIPSLINGVSQQVPSQRLLSQLERGTNCQGDIVNGFGRRQPTRHIKKLTSASLSSAHVSLVRRDIAERYTIVITNGDLRVFDLFTGDEKVVSFPNGKGYLNNTNPRTGFRTTTAGDYNFIVNKRLLVAMDGTLTSPLASSALVFFRQGSYAASIGLTINGITWSMSLPTAGAASLNPDLEANVKTNSMAAAFANYLNNLTVTAGNVFTGPGYSLGSLGYTANADGPLILINNTAGAVFTVQSASDRGYEGMRVLKGATSRLSDLPARGWAGFQIKIVGDADITGSEFWVEYKVSNQLVPGGGETGTSGGWVEIPAPSTRIAFNRATMPHALTSNSNGTFTFQQVAWDSRKAGDTETIPEPSFVGKSINDVFFAKGRLGFLTGENVVCSKPNNEVFNFWRKKANQVLDDDPIDVGVTSDEVSILNSASVFSEDIMIFSDVKQFRLSSDDLFTPKTVSLKPLSSYENAPEVKPVDSGRSLIFLNEDRGFTSVFEYAIRGNGQSLVAEAQQITDHVPEFLRGAPLEIRASSADRMLVVRTDETPKTIYHYQYYDSGNERQQAAWHDWTYGPDAEVLGFDLLDNELVLVVQHNDGAYLEYQKLKPSVFDDGHIFPVHLDRRIRKSQCVAVYEPAQNITRFTIPYAHSQFVSGRFMVVPLQTNILSIVQPPVVNPMINNNTFVLTGNWTDTKDFFAGVEYFSAGEISEQFMPAQSSEGKAVRHDGRLTLRRMKALHRSTLGIASSVSSRANDWERGYDPIVIATRPLEPDEAGYNPDLPDNGAIPPDTSGVDQSTIDLVETDQRVYTALKTFDSNVYVDPTIFVEYLSPEIVNDPNINLSITNASPPAGRLTGVPNTLSNTATWPQDYNFDVVQNGFQVIGSGNMPITGTTSIPGGKFAYTVDYEVVTFNADGSPTGNVIQLLIDGTAPNSSRFNNGQGPSDGYLGLRVISTGKYVRFKRGDNAEPPLAANEEAFRALIGSSPVSVASADYRIFVYAHTDASYFIGSPAFDTQGVWANTFNPTAGSIWAEVWYLAGGAFPVPVSSLPGGDIFDTNIRDQMTASGAVLRDRSYVNPDAIFLSQFYRGPSRVRVDGVSQDGRYTAQLFAVADSNVLLGTSTIGAGGIATFPTSAPGLKKIRVIDSTTGRILTDIGEGIGLVRSYKIPQEGTDPAIFSRLSDRCYLYDQGVAIIAASIKDDEVKAERWTRALLKAQVVTGPDAGQFPFSVNQFSGIPPDPYYRNGATFWCAEALAFFGSKFPNSPLMIDAGPNGLVARLQLCLDHMNVRYLQPAGTPQEGLYRGGKGRYPPDYSFFDPDFLIPWTALEHNVDAYFAYDLAASVCNRPDYTTAAASVGAAIVNKMWIQDQGRLAQGFSPGIVTPTALNPLGYGQDRAGALDLNSWGAMFLVAYGRTDLAVQTMRYLEYFRAVSGEAKGYKPYSFDPTFSDGYAGAVDGVWSEGTFGVVLARRSIGDNLTAIVDYVNMVPALTDEGFQYTTVPDTLFELQNWENVAGTAWAVLAANPRGFWSNQVPGLWETQINPGDLISDPTAPSNPLVPVADANGNIVSVTRDGTSISTLRQTAYGRTYSPLLSAGNAKSNTATYTFPVHKKSTRAVIRLGSVDHLPFNIMAMEWEGFFFGRTQRIQ